MNSDRRRINTDGVFTGLLLIAAGVAVFLQRLGIVQLSTVLKTYWPLFIVLIGMSKLLHHRSVWSGLWMIAIGAWLQAVTLQYHGLTYESSWPLLLVILGAGVIVRTIVESARRRDALEGENRHEGR